MNNIINWICFVSIVFLVSDIMIYFCKDVLKVYNMSIMNKNQTVGKATSYAYKEKIAK